MRRALVVLTLGLLAQSGTVFGQETWADKFMRGYALGAQVRTERERADALRQEAELLAAQRRLIEEQTRQLQEAARQQAAAAPATPTTVTADEAARRAAIAIQAFDAIHPDWRRYEQKMVWFGQRLTVTPNSGLNELHLMEILYVLAKSRLASPEEAVEANPRSPQPTFVNEPNRYR